MPLLGVHRADGLAGTAVFAGIYVWGESYLPAAFGQVISAVGCAAGAFVAWFTGRRKRFGVRPEIIPLRLVLLVSAVPTGMSLWAEIGELFSVGEELRAVAAAPLGASVAWETSLVIRGELA